MDKAHKACPAQRAAAHIRVPNRFFKEWIEDYYPTLITEILEGMLGHAVTLKYRVAEKQATEIKRIEARLENRKTRLASRGIYLNPKYTFENFISGQSNQFAHAAAKAVAETPEKFTIRYLFMEALAWEKLICSAQSGTA